MIKDNFDKIFQIFDFLTERTFMGLCMAYLVKLNPKNKEKYDKALKETVEEAKKGMEWVCFTNAKGEHDTIYFKKGAILEHSKRATS